MKKFYILTLFVLGLAGTTFAQGNSGKTSTWKGSATATASATIIQPINIQNTGDLQFGNIAVNNQPGTVVVATNSSRTSTGGITLPSNTGNISAASFDVTGEQNDTYALSLPTSATLSDNNNNNTMTVNNFVSSLDNNVGTLSNQGTDAFTVGATLNVDANQPAGTYTGTFDVTVNYN